MIVCSPECTESHPEPRSAEDLLGHNCLTYTYQESGTANWLMKRPGRNEIYELQVNGNLSANNARAIRKAVIGGHGIAMVPRCMVYEDLQDGKLTEIPPATAAKYWAFTPFILTPAICR